MKFHSIVRAWKKGRIATWWKKGRMKGWQYGRREENRKQKKES
jgi:hypothetical protein